MYSVYFDLETGGVTESHPDIQLAAIAIKEPEREEVAAFEAKIAFDPKDADPNALALNHYSAEQWSSAESERVVVARFASFLDRFKSIRLVSKRTGNPYMVAKLVGHNAATFDGPRLQRMFQRHERFLAADPRVRCTCQRAMWWFDERDLAPENFQLATLCSYFGIPVEGTHDALGDVRLTIALAGELTKHFRNGAVNG